MRSLPPEQLQTIDAIARSGSFEAAAALLSITPSAVSQRIKALETAVGQVLVQRGRPTTLTDHGTSVVRYARHLALQEADLWAELDGGQPTLGDVADGPGLTVVISSDALATWALAPVVEAAAWAQIEVLREDENHSLDMVRRGAAVAAVTAVSDPVPGCRVTPLGTMRYRAWANSSIQSSWFADHSLGESECGDALWSAPVVNFDRRDDLQRNYAARRSGHVATFRRSHFVPSTRDLMRSVRAGLGWALISDLEIAALTEDERSELVELSPGDYFDVPLYLQRWRLHSASLERFAAAIQRAAKAHLG